MTPTDVRRSSNFKSLASQKQHVIFGVLKIVSCQRLWTMAALVLATRSRFSRFMRRTVVSTMASAVKRWKTTLSKAEDVARQMKRADLTTPVGKKLVASNRAPSIT